MKKHKVKYLVVLIMILSSIFFNMNYSYAHSGRTDSSGGHRDNQNKSGLGGYHYHCGGNPPHLHTNGICPYSSTTISSNKEVRSTYTEVTSPVPKVEPETIYVTGISINEKVDNMEIGEERLLTVSVIPENSTDKTVLWESSDSEIVSISSDGKIIAKKAGEVNITAKSSNGKMSTIKILVNEKEESKDITREEIKEDKKENTVSNIISNADKDSSGSSDSGNSILGLIVLGGGGYLLYSKYKKKK